MVEVIDFKDLSTHLVEQRDPTILGKPSEEEIAKQKKSMNQLFMFGVIFCIVCLAGFIFIHHDSTSTGQEAGAYQADVTPMFSSMQQEFKNLKDITCNEGQRKDCISYTLTFYPQNIDQSQVTQGATPADINRLGAYFDTILQSKLRNLPARKGDLTFKIISTNVNQDGSETKVTSTCVEYHEQIQCANN